MKPRQAFRRPSFLPTYLPTLRRQPVGNLRAQRRMHPGLGEEAVSLTRALRRAARGCGAAVVDDSNIFIRRAHLTPSIYYHLTHLARGGFSRTHGGEIAEGLYVRRRTYFRYFPSNDRNARRSSVRSDFYAIDRKTMEKESVPMSVERSNVKKVYFSLAYD